MNNFEYKWPNGEEDAKVIFGSIALAGADYLHITDYNSKAPAFGESGLTLAVLAKKYGKITVIVNGGIVEPEDAEHALSEGSDLISIAKIALSNHDWPRKVQNGLPIEPFTGDVLGPTPIIKESELLSREQMSVQR